MAESARKDNKIAHEQFNMADRSPIKKAQLKHAVSMKELSESEVRGVHNTGFHEIYEECENIPFDLEDGIFMVRNPQFTKRVDFEYMNEIQSSPWYYGIISRYKAEDILNDGHPVGSFLVRAGIKKGEFYISVKAPEGGPPVLHIEVDRYEDEFVAVCGSSADPVEFPTFPQLLEYLQSAPIHYEGFSSDIILKDFVANDDSN